MSIRQRVSFEEAGGTPGTGLFTAEQWQELAESLPLSPRELEIVQAVFEDAKELAIAHQLKISPHTVHTHLERVYRKLGISSRVQLVLRVVARHLSIRDGHPGSSTLSPPDRIRPTTLLSPIQPKPE